MTDETAALYEVRDRVGVITLNRPDQLNAVNGALATAVGNALEAAAGDPLVRVVVITGNGRAFCAGADLKALASGVSISAEGHDDWGFAGIAQHWIDKPVIAAVNGFAMGGGAEIVLSCDLVVAAGDATFGLPEVKRGLIAAGGGLLRLQHQVPLRRALEMALTGQPVDAETAASWGLVNRVVAPGQALEEALVLAATIAENAPLAVRHSKGLIHRNAATPSTWNTEWGTRDPWKDNLDSLIAVFTSADAKEGPRAFAEKRLPQWADG